MIGAFPHHYDVELRWSGGFPAALEAPPRPSVAAGPPPQFGGMDSWWSPEHLLLSSLGLCLMTTFLALAKKAGLDVKGYGCRASGVLDKTKDGIVFTSLTLDVSLKAEEADRERLQSLVHTAKKYCIVSNSLKPPIILNVRAETSAPAA